MELIERIGAFLGLAAFVGLGILALLYFIQGREVKRLRDWAGRAPERAEAAAAQAEAALSGQQQSEPAEGADPTLSERLRSGWERARGRLPSGVGDRLPAPIWLAAIALVIVLVGVGLATGGFGLLGEDEPAGKSGRAGVDPSQVEVAVLNGTAVTEGAPGVPGLAATVGDEVKKVGYKLGPVTDAGTPFAETVVMYDDGSERAARQVAADVSKPLGNTPVQEMTGDVREQSGDASVAVVIGQDDSQL